MRILFPASLISLLIFSTCAGHGEVSLSMFRQDPQHTGFYDEFSVPGVPDTTWAFNTGNSWSETTSGEDD